MTIVTDLNHVPFLKSPSSLTIGSFDGVHLGHQALLHHLKTHSPSDTPLVVFTFSNHPSHHFSSHSPVSLIYPKEQKLKFLFDCGASLILMIPFNTSFSNTLFDDFLTFLKTRLNFSLLVLGEGSTLGKGRKGDETHVKALGHTLQFKAEYLPKTTMGAYPISSHRIRIAIKSANFIEASSCLGRRYCLFGQLLEKEQQFLLAQEGICLPPPGSYSVELKTENFICPAIVHITQNAISFPLEIKSKDQPKLNSLTAELLF